jgi:hypothetical protein
MVDNYINFLKQVFFLKHCFDEEAMYTLAFEAHITWSVEKPNFVFMDKNRLEHVHNLTYEELLTIGICNVRSCLI